MLFTLKGTSPPDVLLAEEHIEFVRNNKYLGCVIDEGVAMIRFAYMYLFFVKRLIFFAYIYPFICYSSLIWGGAANLHVHKILVLQKAAIRALFCLSSLSNVQP